MNKSQGNNWPALIISALTMTVVITMPMASMPVLFKEISLDLGLDLVQIGSIWGVVSFGSIFIMPFGGILCDRIGNKRIIVIICFLSGLVGILRGFSNSFSSLLLTTFLWGSMCFALLPALTVIVSLFASRERQGLAQGLVGAGGSFGFAFSSMISASLLSPLLGGWRNIFIFYGIFAIAFGFIWIFGIKNTTLGQCKTPAIPFHQIFAHIFRIKDIWLLGLSMLTYQGCVMGMQGFLPYHLQSLGWTTLSAGAVLATLNIVSAFGSIPISVISDKIGARKLFLFIGFLITIICVGLLSVLHNEMVWLLAILIGLFFSTSSAIISTMCVENSEVGPANAGSAVGIMLGITFIGRSFAAPIGNSMAYFDQNISWPFIFWAILALAGLLITAFIKETGHQNGQDKTVT